MKYLSILLIAPLLTGCFATFDGKLDNRIACTVGKDKGFFVSEYGPVGIAATISAKDTAVICR